MRRSLSTPSWPPSWELHDTVDPGMVDDVTAQMSSEQARIVYLRLARKSAIEGYERLLAFASQKAMAHSEGADGDSDPRAVLYANMGFRQFG